MKYIKGSIVLVLVFYLLIVGNTPAQENIVPTMINYQGFLTDETGAALNGSYKITFALFSEPTGAASIVWEEVHDVINVENGLFNVLLGSLDTLTAADLAGERYLGITVAGEVEMTPRMQLASVAYSMHTDHAMQSDSAAYANNIVIKGEPAFRFKRYHLGDNLIRVDYLTTFKTAEWAAAIVGFNMGYGDITESGSHELWEVRMKNDTDGYWHIFVEAPTSDHPEWIIDAMFVRIALASMEGYSAED
jgi:hypothetical protein